MIRYSAVTLDLSRFPPPLALRDMDWGRIYSERLERLKAVLDAKGFDYSVEMLVTDTAGWVQHGDAEREMLVIGAVNDAVRAVMPAFAMDADLDHLALLYGITRRVIGHKDDGTPILEGNDEFRRQVLLAPEAFSTAGTPGGYMFWALRADPRVLNVDVWSPAPGEVTVAVQSREGDGLAPTDLVAAVRGQ
ncbi:baseplate assembly protein, partial [Metarhizobium album]